MTAVPGSPRPSARALPLGLPFVLLAAPPLLVVAFDVARRGPRLSALGGASLASYALTLLESAVLWGVLLVAAAGQRGVVRHVAALLAVVLPTLALGAQRYFHDQYATYINVDAALFGATFGKSLVSQLRADGGTLLRAHALPLLVSAALVVLARLALAPSPGAARGARWVMAPVIAAPFLLPCSFRTVQASTPDVLYFHALGGLVRARLGLLPRPAVLPGEHTAEYLPAIAPDPRPRRNVVFVLTESVRADTVCSAYDERCAGSPFSNAAVPARLPLLQMRANDSTTAVSVAVLFTGLSPLAPREDILKAPMIWEYAHAAGWDTAYWTSQDLRFGNSDMFIRNVAVGRRISGAELDRDADLDLGAPDPLVTAHAKRELSLLKEPFVAVVHYSNTHFPYWVPPGQAGPFQPAELTKDPEKTTDFKNHFRNAVHEQDRTIGDLVRSIRESPLGPRTVIVFTSDHGEAFREHTQLGHTLSVYDEEVHVPAWIDAPPGTLTDVERASVAARRDVPAFHVDVVPTLLDLVGVLDAPELARHRARMTGESLLRPLAAPVVQPLTNCNALWSCPFNNWGVMRGPYKLEARAWDATWHCFDVLADPDERRDLGPAACGDLESHALRLFGAHPSRAAQ